jgi:hypothetical protein
MSGQAREGRPTGEAPPPANGAAPDALRQLVREVLRDVLPGLVTEASQNGPPPAAPTAPPAASSAPPADPTAPPAARTALSAPPAGSPAPSAIPPTSEPGPPRPAGAASAGGAARAAGGHETASRPGASLQPVRLATDQELHEFVLHVLALADNPKRRRDLLAGRLRFTLAPAAAVANAAEHRVEEGAVTERAVQAAASAGARLVLGPRAVLTPLARDRARALGVPIEKER